MLREQLAAFYRAVRSQSGPPADLDRWFTPSSTLEADRRIAIYHRAYYFRQLEVLQSTYPKVRETLGDQDFTELCLKYIAEHPSSHPCVEYQGEALAGFLSSRGLSVASDVARFEWATLEALIAPDPRNLLDSAQLNWSSLPSTRFFLVPSVRLLSIAPTAAHLLGFEVEPSAAGGRQSVAVWRRRYSVNRRLLAADESLALKRLEDGHTFAEVCDLFAEKPDQAIQRVFSLLRTWLSLGILDGSPRVTEEK